MKFDSKKIWQWVKYIILGGFIVKIIGLAFLKKDAKKIEENLEEFIKEEEKEVKELTSGKESLKKYISDTCSIFTDFFIPTEQNGYKPKILRTRPLVLVAVILVVLKLFGASYLFLIYPNIGKMAQMVSEEIFNLINVERGVNKLNALMFNVQLNKAAQAKAEDMIKNNYFAHKSPDGRMPWDWIDRGEYAYLYAGENLAMNFTTANSAHQALMFSESHKKNILNGKYSDIGIAVAKGIINGRETNILVEFFGSAKSVVKPALAKETNKETNKVEIVKETAPPSPKPSAKMETQFNILPSEQGDIKDNQGDENKQPFSDELAVSETDKPTTTVEIIAEIQNEERERTEIVSGAELSENLSAIPAEVKVRNDSNSDFIGKFIFYSQYIFLAALLVMTLLLIINIFVKISVQHKPVIIQTLLVIILIAGLLSVKIHFLEGVSQKIIIF